MTIQQEIFYGYFITVKFAMDLFSLYINNDDSLENLNKETVITYFAIWGLRSQSWFFCRMNSLLNFTKTDMNPGRISNIEFAHKHAIRIHWHISRKKPGVNTLFSNISSAKLFLSASESLNCTKIFTDFFFISFGIKPKFWWHPVRSNSIFGSNGQTD